MAAEITKKRVVYQIPGMEAVPVRRGVEYAGPLTMDLYYPLHQKPAVPAVVIVLGFPDVGVPLEPLGCQYREMGMAISWAQLFAASGMAGIIYESRNPASDLGSVLSCLRDNGESLGIDGTRLGVWATSGNAPVALSSLMNGSVSCGVLSCGYMLDLEGATAVAEAAAQYHFANPMAGKRVEDMSGDVALFIARAGRDQFPGVNESIDAFVAGALRCNLPVTLVNHATGPHGFDLLDDTEASRDIMRAKLAFLQAKLGA